MPMCMDWLKRHWYGCASSLDSSRSRRLLRPSGPEALPVGSYFKTDSTSSAVKIILSRGTIEAGGCKSGRTAFSSFKIVWL